jgi:hypothetical protein
MNAIIHLEQRIIRELASRFRDNRKGIKNKSDLKGAMTSLKDESRNKEKKIFAEVNIICRKP